MVKEPDVYVLGGLLAREGDWTYRSLADDLRVPHAVVQRALARAEEASLYSSDRREVHRAHFEEFAVHALRFVAPARLGPLTAGVPAAWAAEPIAKAIVSSGDDPPPVWPHAKGGVRGQAVEPLHAAAPDAAAEWPGLAEILASLDSLRVGDVRVRSVAEGCLVDAMRRPPSQND